MYYLCLKRLFREYLLYRGSIAEFPDILSKYLIPVRIHDRPEGGIRTFFNGSVILANNDQCDSNGKLIDVDYAGIYKTVESAFFLVQQKRREATLKAVGRDEAEKMWYKMPHKLITNEDVFLDPREVNERNVRYILKMAEETQPQREYEERVKKIKKQPYWWLLNPWLADDARDFD